MRLEGNPLKGYRGTQTENDRPILFREAQE
jgi:hypothetical protein